MSVIICNGGLNIELKYLRTVDVYYVYYRSRRPGDVEMDWEEQVVETVNNTINHMVSAAMLMTMMRWEEKMLKVSKMSAKKYKFQKFWRPSTTPSTTW